MSRIFISYRREDTEDVAGRLYDALKARFGGDRVFRDVYALRPGEQYAKAIDRVISEADAVLVLIGPRWLAGIGETGAPRLQDPADLLRGEIATALSGGKWVIPVLVDGAQMPVAAALPEDLIALLDRNAIELSDARWEYDVGLLTRALRTRGVGRLRPPAVVLVSGVVVLAALALGVVFAQGLFSGRPNQPYGPNPGPLTEVAPGPTPATRRSPASTQETAIVGVKTSLPVISAFNSPSASVNVGEPVRLTWSVQNADTVEVTTSDGFSIVKTNQSAGSVIDNPSQSTTYTLTASGPDGRSTASFTVDVRPPASTQDTAIVGVKTSLPVISTFNSPSASVNLGEPVRLTWSVQNADTVEVTTSDGFSIVKTSQSAGSVIDNPSQSTTYILTATGPGGLSTASFTVDVRPPGATPGPGRQQP